MTAPIETPPAGPQCTCTQDSCFGVPGETDTCERCLLPDPEESCIAYQDGESDD